MTEAARQAQREYYRRYRAEHREQIRENNRRYWERKANDYETDRKTAGIVPIERRQTRPSTG